MVVRARRKAGMQAVRIQLISPLRVALFLLAAALVACGPNRAALPTSSPRPMPVTAATGTPLHPTTLPARTLTLKPAQTSTPQITATAAPAEATRAARQRAARLASGWTIFSNPDLVKGIAVQGRTLWAATSGGVTAWDLDRGTHTLYTPRDGLSEIQANDIVFCSMPDERILVAHETGILSAYDLKQKRWSHIPISFDDGSTMHGIQVMRCDAANERLLVGSADGLGILNFDTGTWRRIGAEQGLRANQITAIDVAGQAIWVAAGEQAAFLIIGGTVFPFNGASGFPSGAIYDVSVGPDGTIWFAYPTTLVRYFDRKWLSYGGDSRIGLPFLSMDQVEAVDSYTIWISSADEGVCVYNMLDYACSTLYTVPQDAPITDLIVEEDGVGYASTYGKGIAVLEGDAIRWLAVDNQQLISNDIRDIAESPDGRLWIATDQGVNVFDPRQPEEPWQVIAPQRNGLVSGRISGLQPVNGGMWFFYDQRAQASFFDGEIWTQMEPGKGVLSEVLDAAQDSRGYLWFATRTGIDVWDGSIMRSYGPETGLPGSAYLALQPDDGGMWVGTEHGLVRYSRFQWSTPLPDIPVNAILPAGEGELLLGTSQGLVRFDGRESYLWIINLGDEVLINPHVTSLARDHKDGLWVGTQQDGLFWYDGVRWEQFNTARGLPTNSIRKVFVDRSGAVWIITSTGETGGALVRFMP